MGVISSDFFTGFDKMEVMEMPFSAGELFAMASVDLQLAWAQWLSEHEDSTWLPPDIFLALLEDRPFLAQILMLADGGECLVLSGVTQAYNTEHMTRMGLTEQDLGDNLLRFYENADSMADHVQSALAGSNEWVSCLYVFANGWLGVETERMTDDSWMDPEDRDPDYKPSPEPASSYLLTDEGDLVATPDIRFDIGAWMDFVDMFSAINEEASAGEPVSSRKETQTPEERPLNDYIVLSDEVREAMSANRPVVVIESAATFGGMIYPGIEEFAASMGNTVREHGAVPAFAAILGGQIHIGLTEEETQYLAQRRGSIPKASARDIPVLLAMQADGVMTIAAAVQTAAMVGLPFACGSGIGGAQIGAEKTMDISTDLEALARNQVMVVCSGTKPILDLPLTMEYLETAGVPVIGYGTDRMPEYMVRGSGFRLTYRMDTPAELALVMKIKKEMKIPGGVLVVNPVPKEYELDPVSTREAVEKAMEDVKRNRVMGKTITGYMMGRIKDYLGPESMESQKAFLISNAALAAELAGAYCAE
ncbi:MAG: pseudouridine-5'-phosphate glycosidase [Eubacteriales bacterium]|nr:pseudouridine-5'-phosphate glycosidase [Eubacteriales bacterium]